MTKEIEFTDKKGTWYLIDEDKRKIIMSRDRHGFLYDAEGNKTGHIDDKNNIKPLK